MVEPVELDNLLTRVATLHQDLECQCPAHPNITKLQIATTNTTFYSLLVNLWCTNHWGTLPVQQDLKCIHPIYHHLRSSLLELILLVQVSNPHLLTSTTLSQLVATHLMAALLPLTLQMYLQHLNFLKSLTLQHRFPICQPPNNLTLSLGSHLMSALDSHHLKTISITKSIASIVWWVMSCQVARSSLLSLETLRIYS